VDALFLQGLRCDARLNIFPPLPLGRVLCATVSISLGGGVFLFGGFAMNEQRLREIVRDEQESERERMLVSGLLVGICC